MICLYPYERREKYQVETNVSFLDNLCFISNMGLFMEEEEEEEEMYFQADL